jgi:RimJ/RimL family protein N-acetyltransferase
VELRPTTPTDLDFVMAAEADPEASPFVTANSREEHLEVIADRDQSHLIVDEDGPVGFVLLQGLSSPHRNVEIRRIVIADRGRGIGRRALRLVLDRAFGELGAHRVWLDVKPHNERALRAYRAVGFVHEGVLRDALLTDGAYESLAIMSVLEHEWAERAGGAA